MENEKLRLDKYLWAIRLFKTRSAAAVACEKGRVKMSGEAVKASRTVRINDVYEVKTEEKRWTIKVIGLLPKRVQYKEAVQFYEDLTLRKKRKELPFSQPAFIPEKDFPK